MKRSFDKGNDLKKRWDEDGVFTITIAYIDQTEYNILLIITITVQSDHALSTKKLMKTVIEVTNQCDETMKA